MKKIKKDDNVKVISGNYKGQTGRVIKIISSNNRAIVEGINKVKKHMRPNQENPQGGIVEKEMSIDISNLMLMNKNKPVKVGFKFHGKDNKESGSRIDYMFTTKSITSISGHIVNFTRENPKPSKTLRQETSDHLPILGIFLL